MNDWVLVTGGARRLGREICLEFARAGWNVTFQYFQSQQAAQELLQTLREGATAAAAVRCRLDSAQDAEELFRQALALCGGAPRCIVNNASEFVPDAGGAFAADQFQQLLGTNLLVPLVLARELHARLAQAPQPPVDASILHVLDQKVFNLNPDYFSYTLSKLALERAVPLQAQSLAPLLRVNGVAPGLMYPSGPQTHENFALAQDANLLRRQTDPARVAQTVRFLAENPCITGQTLCVDGGQHLVPLPRDIMFVVDELLRGAHHGSS